MGSVNKGSPMEKINMQREREVLELSDLELNEVDMLMSEYDPNEDDLDADFDRWAEGQLWNAHAKTSNC